MEEIAANPLPRPEPAASDLEVKEAQLIFSAVWSDLQDQHGRDHLRFPREFIWLGGAPGAGKGTNTVLCVVVNVIDFDMDARAAVDAPRLHHQWFPDEAHFEGMKEYAGAVKRLKEMGHAVVGAKMGDAHTIWVNPKTGEIIGAEDRRIDGKAAGF